MNDEFPQERLIIKETLIHKKIFLFAYTLLKNIFIVEKDKNRLKDKLDEWVKYINTNIIKVPEKYINKEYSLKNLNNIIIFIESQNSKYCGDITEHILILIFSKVFHTIKDNTISKYIFNNLILIRDHNDREFFYWIKKGNLNKEEFTNLETLFDIDGKEDETNPELLKRQNKSVFYNFLREIMRKKYVTPFNKCDKKRNKNMLYINNSDCLYYKLSKLIYNKIKKYDKNKKGKAPDITILDKDILLNSMARMEYNLTNKLSEENKPFNQLILCFFTQVFIYYQNKNSPLLKYTLPSENLSTIPFSYDLQGALVEGRFSSAIIAPLRVGDLISNIYLKLNNIRESGLYELGKLCVFNDRIKLVEYDTCLLRTYYLDYMIQAMGMFDNHSIEEINFSNNVLKEDLNDALIKIVKHFKNLKTINLSSADIHKNLGPFFVVLKKLYRQKKTKLENIILNKGAFDESTFVELGELLKCKYCKLKVIYFSNNPIPLNLNFLKKIKSNKSLREIYLIKTDISDSYVNDIMKIISLSNIRTLYLPKNQFSNFNNFLRILFRTKILKNRADGVGNIIINEDTTLLNLDLSTNEFFNKNEYHINLLKKIIKETSIYCLDICHILQGINPERKKLGDMSNYNKGVEDLKSFLVNQQKDYTNIIKIIRKSKNDISKFNNLEKENIKGKDKVKNYMNQINNNENAIHPIFMKKLAKKIIIEENEKNEKYNKKDVDTLANYLMLQNSKFNLNQKEIKKNIKKLIII